MRKCPSCRSTDVRRSAISPGEEQTWRDRNLVALPLPRLQAAILGVGGRTYRAGASVVAAIAIAALAYALFSWLMAPDMKGGRRSSVDNISSMT